MAKSEEPITIKKYANRRLYNTGTSTYVTLEDLAVMVKAGEDFVVYDAKTSEDITRSVLAQIIFEQENKEGQNLLPDQFPAPADPLLRRQHADDGAALPRSVDRLADPGAGEVPRPDRADLRHRRVRRDRGAGAAEHGDVRAHVRDVRAVRAPGRERQPKAPSTGQASRAGGDDIDELKRQMEEMQKRLDRMGDKDK